MRTPLAFLAVALAAATGAATPPAPPAPPPSAAILLHAHPRAWHFPAAGAGLRGAIDPATGDWTSELAPIGSPGDARAARAAALAQAAPQTRPDGSGYAIVAGLFRAYAVARVAPDGSLVQDCLGSEPAALRRLAVPAQPAPAAEDR